MRTKIHTGRAGAWPALTLLLALVPILTCRPSGPAVPGPAGFPTPKASARGVGQAPAPGTWSAPATPPRPVHVVFKSPTKRTQGRATIQVTFDQPMVRLGRVKSRSEDPGRYPIEIRPAVTAVYRWVAGDTLKVSLTKPLQNATRYHVRLLPTLRSLSDTKLATPVAWSFETPRPRVLSLRRLVRHQVRAHHLHPSAQFEVRCNQPVRPAQLARVLRLTAGGRRVDVKIHRDPKDPHRLVVTPRAPLPLGRAIVLRVRKGLHSEHGALPGVEGTERTYRTYGPLRVQVRCNDHSARQAAGGKATTRCWPMQNGWYAGLHLRFTEPVTEAELLRHVRITPPIPGLRKRLQATNWTCSIQGRKKVRCAQWWAVTGDLKPAARYTVTVAPGLRDAWGQRLGARHRARFDTRDYPPGLHLPHGDEAAREPWHPWRFQAMNATDVTSRLYVYTGSALVRFITCLRKKGGEWPQKCVHGAPTSEQKLRLRGPRNRMITSRIRLPGGLVAIRLRSPQVVNDRGKPVPFDRIALQTDLGLHVRMSAFGVTAWVTSLRTGQPVSGVQVTVYSRQGAKRGRGVTDATGLVHLPRQALGGALKNGAVPHLLVMARKGRDLAYVAPNGLAAGGRYHEDWGRFPRLSVSLGSSSSWTGDQPELVGYVSTERGIYRPGHRVYVHGAVRRFVTWKGAPAPRLPVQVRLVDPTGRVVDRHDATTNDWGVFLARLSVPRVGRQGRFRVLLYANKEHLATRYLRVAEYRAPRFVARVRATPQDVFADGTLNLALAGRYLFGGAMAGAGYRLEVNRYPQRYSWQRWPGYHAGESRWTLQFKRTLLHRSEGTLDAHGRRVRRLPLTDAKHPHLPWIASVRTELEVRSAARRTAATWSYNTQFPGDRIAAIKALDSRPDLLRYHVRVVDAKGRPFAHRGVRAELLAVKKGRYSWRPKILWRQVVWKKTLDVSARGAHLTIRWPKKYDRSQALLRLRVTDAKGREAWTADLVRRPTAWSLQQEREERRNRERKAELTVALDQKRYLPGAVAQVTVTRSRDVRSALLLVERERIFMRTPLRFNAAGVARVKVPVRPAFARSVTVRVIGVRAGKALRGARGPLLAARARLVVKDEPYRLNVALETDHKKYRPGGKVRVKIAVRDLLKRPRKSAVVLMAVDEAVLNLTHYWLPDPYGDLAHTPENGVQAADLRAFLTRLGIVVNHVDHTELRGMGGGGVGYGGGMGVGGMGRGGGGAGGSRSKKRPRRNFRTTAWHHTLVTDDQGRATASFTLPDNVTGYRIMAFAVDRERSAGTGRTRFEVDLPLLTLPALPRFLREGDRAQAGVVLYNTGLPSGTATVSAQVAGDAVALTGATTKRVHLKKGRATEVRFDLQARRKGSATFTFHVRAAGVSDRMQWPLSVIRPALPEASSVSGETQGAVRHGVEALSGLRPDIGGLEVRLTSTALAGVEDGMDQLVHYPYGCLEQTSSRLLPLIAALVMSKRFKLKLPHKPRAMIRDGLARVLAMQRRDGGFGFWPKATESFPWATAYALIVLRRAQRAARVTGIEVPRAALRRALSYMRRNVHLWMGVGRYWYSVQAFLLYAMGLHGMDVSHRALTLYRHRRHRPLFARALVLATLARSKRTPAVRKAVAELLTEMGDSLKVDGTTAHAEEGLPVGYQVLMHSDARTSAMVLLALLHAQPSHAMITRLVRWFLVGRAQARFRNTQEAAWALMAFWDFAEIREKTVPDFEAGVWLGKSRVVTARFRGRSVKPVTRKIPMRELLRVAGRAARALVVAKRGKGTLYYVARLRYARRQLPRAPRDHGFAVRKQIQVLDRAGRPLRHARAPRLGDTVLVTLRVTSTQARRYVVVDDPLPAGMEPIDTSLANTGTHGVGAIDWRTTSFYDHRELRDDRALFFRNFVQPGTLVFRYLARITSPGRYLAPPSRAEEMYNPEIFGHTATRQVHYPAP